jgi:hypothetical protein
VNFMHYDLGYFDLEAGRVECVENPFDAKLLAGCNRIAAIIASFSATQ